MQTIRMAMALFFEKYTPQIKQHFDLVRDGKEDLVIVLWVWGGFAYFLSFLISGLVSFIHLIFVKWILCAMVIAYFVWHIIIIRRCSPKKIPLSKEEKKKLKQHRFKKFLQKLFLKEPLTKWNPSIVATVIDIYVIVCFVGFLIK